MYFFLVQLMRDLPNLNEKNKERPLCCPYSVKARALIHAHLTRLNLPPETLELGNYLILLGRLCHWGGYVIPWPIHFKECFCNLLNV